MYEPPHHREMRLDVLHELIRTHPLGLLVSSGPDGPVADPVPFLLDGDIGHHGRLRAHIARANPQARLLTETTQPVLVVFQGPQTYVTPSWYKTKRETGKVVPTWNYVMVQVRGRATIIDDRTWLAGQIAELTGVHEGSRAEPWQVSDAPEKFIEAQIKGIIGVQIEITDMSGKWKVSQNRPVGDRKGVAEGLASATDSDSADMLSLVRSYGGLDR